MRWKFTNPTNRKEKISCLLGSILFFHKYGNNSKKTCPGLYSYEDILDIDWAQYFSIIKIFESNSATTHFSRSYISDLQINNK